MLVQETVKDLEQALSSRRGDTTPEQRKRIFKAKMHKGDVRGAVQYVVATERSGVLVPTDTVDESGDQSVLDVLQSKHPDAWTPNTDPSFFPQFDSVPDFVDVHISEKTVAHVAGRLSGSAGLAGADADAVMHYLTHFGTHSQALRCEMAAFTEWLANGTLSFAAYRALMAGRLIALDKMPGVQPIGVGETW